MSDSHRLHTSSNESLKIISDEHFHLLEGLENLKIQFEQKPVDPHLVALTLATVLQEVDAHFEHEEEIMLEAAYPKYLEHKKEHARILALLMDISCQYRKGEWGQGGDLEPLIESLMLTHIDDFDEGILEHFARES